MNQQNCSCHVAVEQAFKLETSWAVTLLSLVDKLEKAWLIIDARSRQKRNEEPHLK